jgi:P27 family predicted phage terminase small subunit
MKALTGNPGKRPLNPHEPRPEPAAPECPPELSPIARQEWLRLTAELAKLNMITHLDRGALATYCGAYALWAEAMVQIQKYGTMVKSPSGYPMQSPYQQAGRADDAHRIRVRLHACKPQQDIGTTAGSVAAAGPDCQRL